MNSFRVQKYKENLEYANILRKNNAVFYRFLLTITQLKNTENPMVPENRRTQFETIQ